MDNLIARIESWIHNCETNIANLNKAMDEEPDRLRKDTLFDRRTFFEGQKSGIEEVLKLVNMEAASKHYVAVHAWNRLSHDEVKQRVSDAFQMWNDIMGQEDDTLKLRMIEGV